MALYTIGDTHLSETAGKPMDVFGGVWHEYRGKLVRGLSSCLKEEDTLVLCGDFSWGMSLKEALADFRLLDGFPGRKILLKGNHDYWWETIGKMEKFFAENAIKSLYFLHNNCIFYRDVALCGTRGWFFDPSDPSSGDGKVFRRELIRLEASLKQARQQRPECEIDCFLHYPPVFGGTEVPLITQLLRRYGVRRCFYGHLHGESLRCAFCGERDGVQYRVVSADALNFEPLFIQD